MEVYLIIHILGFTIRSSGFYFVFVICANMSKRLGSPAVSTPKKKKYTCKFKTEWISMFGGCITRSDKGDTYAFCTVCDSKFSVASGGRNDIERHLKGTVHGSNVSASKQTVNLKSLFTHDVPDKVTKAEVLFANFVAEHNLPFLVADHFTQLCKVMFPDSDIASKFSSKRTKTTHMINGAIAPVFNKKVTSLCKKEKFSVMIDESNDNGDDKCLTILVRVLDRDIKKVTTRFLAMPICNIRTAQNIFSCLNKVLV